MEAQPTQGAWRVRRGFFARVTMGGYETLHFVCLLGQSQLHAKGWGSVLPRSGKAEEWEKVYVLLHPTGHGRRWVTVFIPKPLHLLFMVSSVK